MYQTMELSDCFKRGNTFMMDMSSVNKAKMFWDDRNPEDFEFNAKVSGRMAAIKRMAEIAKPYLSKNVLSIDLGCGTGLFEKVAERRNVIGVDFSPSFLSFAQTRMDKVMRGNIFDLPFENNTVDNIISLFVIEDYPNKWKEKFFQQIFSLLKKHGYFFFSAYSPNDERMGKMRKIINKISQLDFEVYLEDSCFYENILKKCGFDIIKSEIINANGLYYPKAQKLTKSIKVKREFILIVAQKNLKRSHK